MAVFSLSQIKILGFGLMVHGNSLSPSMDRYNDGYFNSAGTIRLKRL
jgi:hypothetical protein